MLDTVPGTPAVVVSTPGAEPVAEGGYAAALLLDGWAMLSRPDLRAGEDALRRWMGAAALVRPQPAGGTVVVVAEPTLRPVQALVRWDPAGYAVRELGERGELGFPPVSRMAAVAGPGRRWPSSCAPWICRPRRRCWVRCRCRSPRRAAPGARARPRRGAVGPRPGPRPPGSGAALAGALKAAQAARMARGGSTPVWVRIDPPDIG